MMEFDQSEVDPDDLRQLPYVYAQLQQSPVA